MCTCLCCTHDTPMWPLDAWDQESLVTSKAKQKTVEPFRSSPNITLTTDQRGWYALSLVLCPLVTKINTRRVATKGAVSSGYIAEWHKTTLSQSQPLSCFSMIGIHFWNYLQTEIKSQTDLKTFNRKVKHWLKETQTCKHWACRHTLCCPYSNILSM